jgi:di/tricarboxylate transporter
MMTRFERSLIIGFGVSLVWCQLLAPWLLSTSKVSSNRKFYQGLAEMLGERYIPFTGNSGMNFLVCVVFATLALCFWDFGLKENSALDAGIRLTACVAGAAGVGITGLFGYYGGIVYAVLGGVVAFVLGALVEKLVFSTLRYATERTS